MLTPELQYTDQALLKAMAADDREAFTMLYRRYWEDLFATAARVLRSKEEAADVVQDVFLSFWNRRHELDINGPVAAYLRTSARYKAIHYIEKNITRRDYLAMLTETEVSRLVGSPELQVQLKELQSAIHKAVVQMPPKMQEVYRLSREQHLPHKEIAEQLGISDETVKKHIQHALQAIRKAIGDVPGSLTLLLFALLY